MARRFIHLNINRWSLVVVLVLAGVLVLSLALQSAIGTEGMGDRQGLSPLPTSEPPVTVTSGWWGEVAFPTSTPTMTVTPVVTVTVPVEQ